MYLRIQHLGLQFLLHHDLYLAALQARYVQLAQDRKLDISVFIHDVVLQRRRRGQIRRTRAGIHYGRQVIRHYRLEVQSRYINRERVADTDGQLRLRLEVRIDRVCRLRPSVRYIGHLFLGYATRHQRSCDNRKSDLQKFTHSYSK